MMLVVKNAIQTCDCCPSQWNADTLDGRKVYIRYRHGELTVGIGIDQNAAVENAFSGNAFYRGGSGEDVDDDVFITWQQVMSATGIKEQL